MPVRNLNILFLEPFYGGSHKAFADGLVHHSSHSITLKTMPARFWKWRMRGAALHYLEKIQDWDRYDLIFATDLMSISDLKVLCPVSLPPVILYFHESQLSYPLPEGEKMDYQFGFTDITSALTADAIIFNSQFHSDQFFKELPRFIRKMPEFLPKWAVDKIKQKSNVIHPGADLNHLNNTEPKQNKKPRILWNHRWEFDKNPELFFDVIDSVDKKGADFDLILLGENFQSVPTPFITARKRYRERILAYGYAESREEYYSWLQSADITISTAIQENFGLSVVEAVSAGAFPLLPDRLSYPEVVPESFHSKHIYSSRDNLEERLLSLLKDGIPTTSHLSKTMTSHDWSTRIHDFDNLFISSLETGN